MQINYEKNLVRLNGDPAELMLFYTTWQNRVWKDWTDYPSLGLENDHLTKQTRGVLQACGEGEIVLSTSDEKLKDAVQHAITFMSKIGVSIN